MPNYNGVEKFTVVNGGGTINLDVLHASTTRYVFSGTATLSSGYTIQATGTPVEGMEFDIRWQSACTTSGANVVTVFGTTLTTAQALTDLIITVYYNGSAWDVDIQQDGVEDIWEVGTGSLSAKRVGLGGTASATGSLAESNGTSSGNYSHTEGTGCTASTTGCHAEGNGTTASGSASHSEGTNTIASGANSHAEGYTTIASTDYAHAEGSTTTASASGSHAGGINAIASRYGQFSRSSGKTVDVNATDYCQFSKLTLWGNTQDATPSLLYLDGTASALSSLTIPANSIAYFRGEGVAIQQGGSAGTVGDNASFHFNGCITNISGTTSLTDTVRWQDNTGAWGASAQRTQVAAAATWTMVPTANNGTDTLDITVTGEADKDIQWLVNIELTEIRYTP